MSVQYRALPGVLPRLIITPATAMPSGMLWTPMAMVTSNPCVEGRRSRGGGAGGPHHNYPAVTSDLCVHRRGLHQSL